MPMFHSFWSLQQSHEIEEIFLASSLTRKRNCSCDWADKIPSAKESHGCWIANGPRAPSWSQDPLSQRSPTSDIYCLMIWGEADAIEIKCAIKLMCLNHLETILHPGPWKNGLPWNRSLMPQRLGTASLSDKASCDLTLLYASSW